MKKKVIYFFAPYPLDGSPSQRFRFEQYLAIVESNGFKITFLPFLSQSHSQFRSENRLFVKAFTFARALFRRVLQLRIIKDADWIFIHREIAPVGPPLFEWLIFRFLKKKIIYDFDDAIWLTDRTGESPLTKVIRWRWKVASICKWSHKVSCGNPYLAAYARQFNPNVYINPTTIDTINLHNPEAVLKMAGNFVTIGWTGSHSTLKYLEGILPVLHAFEKKYPNIAILLIADKDPELRLKNVIFRPWRKETEIADLAGIDIGIMPMPDDPWTRGKCGFKALQYMAMNIPTLVSPVGVNREIVEHGVDGYWCTTYDEWFTSLEVLTLDAEKRDQMGRRGRQKVIDRYSVAANSANFMSLFQ